MKTAEKGDTVKVHYTGRLTNGNIFDSSEDREPLEFEIGAGMMIEGFDEGVLGMSEGGKKILDIPAAKAYGEWNPDYVITVDRENLPPDIPLEKGLGLELSNPDGGHPIAVTIRGFDDSTITLDANHSLAGKDLVFDVEMVGILKRNSI